MKSQMEVDIEGACESARIKASKYTGYIANEDPVKTVIEWFDAEVKSYIQPDEQIEQARANVIALSGDLRDAHDKESARRKVLESIDELERVTLERPRKTAWPPSSGSSCITPSAVPLRKEIG